VVQFPDKGNKTQAEIPDQAYATISTKCCHMHKVIHKVNEIAQTIRTLVLLSTGLPFRIKLQKLKEMFSE
jgi:hypothetical protein